MSKIYCLVLVLVSNICFSQNNYYEAANKEYFYGDLNKAIELFTRAIENKQEVANSYMYRGASKGFLGRFSEALDDMDSSFNLDPLNKKIDFYFGKIYILKQDYQTAIQYTNKTILKNKDDDAAYDQRAAAYVMLGDFNAAIDDEEIAIKLNPQKSLYYTNRGVAKLKLKLYNEALKDLNASVKLEPSQKAYANRGLLYSLTNQHQQAIADYSESLKFIPSDAEVLYYRGISYQALDRKKEACDDLNKSKNLGYTKADEALNKLKCD